ncbi:hypothetical protein ABI59_18085 [Acidobacteria bacterium Mor1]|nr:hypothetical protein ABI59_18085 [Acidobacteria bacterium Mor1]
MDKAGGKDRYHHGDLRRALIDAAVDLIRTGGVGQWTLREAARRAGVSVAAPYRHFESKQDLLAAVALEGFQRFGAALGEAIARTEGDAFDQLTNIGRGYIRFATENPSFIEVMFGREFSSLDDYPELAAAADSAHDHLLRTVEGCLELLGTEPSVDADVLAVMAWSMVHGLSSLLSSNKLRDHQTPEQAAQLTEAVLQHFERGLRALGGGSG